MNSKLEGTLIVITHFYNQNVHARICDNVMARLKMGCLIAKTSACIAVYYRCATNAAATAYV